VTDLGSLAQVSGPPEEPESGDPGRDERGADPDEPEAPLRGWIEPEDRLWRHPSEQVPAVPGAGPVLSPPPKRRYRGPLMVFIAAAAVAAAGAFLVVLLSPASQSPLRSSGRAASSGGATLTTLTSNLNGVPAAAQTAAKSMVELQATTTHGVVTLIGVAVAEGGMVVTTADLLVGLQRIDMVGPGGKLERASVVGTDVTSNVALVNVPADVPVAPFSDDAVLGAGAPDTALAYVPGGSSLALEGTPGTLAAVATASTNKACPNSGMAAITSSPGLSTQAAGEPLLNSSGAIIGILCEPAPGASAATFLPTQLVVGVADDLRSGNRVVPGVLGVQGSDVPGGTGAKLMTVPAGTPAWGRLQAGEVITALNEQPVRTFAELRARLYVLEPGTPVTLSVQGSPGTTGARTVGVTLGKSS
jgi:putative serine protease PepD